MTLACDLHLHSCLSPCGDDDMTPNNLVNMAVLKGLACIALTDHNTCGNCRAASLVARQAGIGFLPGMELSTAEDIHLVCLFPDVDRAEAFSAVVYPFLPPVKNKPRIYGRQLVLDEYDRPVAEEEKLLINATALSLTEAPALVAAHGGLCYPAHIDKDANSVLAILGAIPPECDFSAVEVSPRYRPGSRPEVEEACRGRRIVTSSDAHYLWDIAASPTAQKSAGCLCIRRFSFVVSRVLLSPQAQHHTCQQPPAGSDGHQHRQPDRQYLIRWQHLAQPPAEEQQLQRAEPKPHPGGEQRQPVPGPEGPGRQCHRCRKDQAGQHQRQRRLAVSHRSPGQHKQPAEPDTQTVPTQHRQQQADGSGQQVFHSVQRHHRTSPQA